MTITSSECRPRGLRPTQSEENEFQETLDTYRVNFNDRRLETYRRLGTILAQVVEHVKSLLRLEDRYGVDKLSEEISEEQMNNEKDQTKLFLNSFKNTHRNWLLYKISSRYQFIVDSIEKAKEAIMGSMLQNQLKLNISQIMEKQKNEYQALLGNSFNLLLKTISKQSKEFITDETLRTKVYNALSYKPETAKA